MLGKQTRSSHSTLNSVTTCHPLELMHLDLVGPIQTQSLSGKKYVLVLVDDFSRFTWVKFLREKSEVFDCFKSIVRMIKNEKSSENLSLVRLRTNHGTEFENAMFDEFYDANGIKHEFSAHYTP